MATERRTYGTYLKQRRGRYLVQVAVPKALRPVLRKAVLERYLGTADARIARAKAPAAVAELRDVIARHGEPLKAGEISALGEAELRRSYDTISTDFGGNYARLSKIADTLRTDMSNLMTDDPDWPATDEPVSNPLLGGETTEDYARKLIRDAGAPDTREAVDALSWAILCAQQAAVELLQRGAAPPPSIAPMARRSRGGTPTLRDVLTSWARERKPPEKTLSEWTRAVRRWEELHGATPVGDITTAQVGAFKDALLRCQARPSHKLRDQPLPKLIESVPEGAALASAAAVNKALGAIRSLLSYAKRNGRIDGNPASGVRALAPPKREDQERRPFTVPEMQKVLDEAAKQKRDADKWLPMLAAFMGAREAEMGQARVSDVRTEGDITYLRITDAGEGRRVKNRGSRRSVPLHPALIDAGFLDYVKKLPKDGPLFPDLVPAAYSKRVNRMIDGLGLDDPTLVFHCFRHGFKDACRAAGIPEEVHDALTGHASASVGRMYGQGVPLAVLAEAVGKIAYPSLKPPKLA